MDGKKRTFDGVKMGLYGFLGLCAGGLLGPTLFVWLMLGTHSAPEFFQAFEATLQIQTHYLFTGHVKESMDFAAIVPLFPSAVFGFLVGLIIGSRAKK